MVRYIKCPRCELNYIDAEKQEYCDVCIKEMNGIRTDVDDFDDEEAAELATELCPVCGENMMRAGEKMCDECRQRMSMEEEEPNGEDDDEWREYLDDDADDMDDDMEDIGETFDEEEIEEEEEEEYADEEEDLEYVTGDEIYTLTDDEDDEDEEDEDFF